MKLLLFPAISMLLTGCLFLDNSTPPENNGNVINNGSVPNNGTVANNGTVVFNNGIANNGTSDPNGPSCDNEILDFDIISHGDDGTYYVVESCPNHVILRVVRGGENQIIWSTDVGSDYVSITNFDKGLLIGTTEDVWRCLDLETSDNPCGEMRSTSYTGAIEVLVASWVSADTKEAHLIRHLDHVVLKIIDGNTVTTQNFPGDFSYLQLHAIPNANKTKTLFMATGQIEENNEIHRFFPTGREDICDVPAGSKTRGVYIYPTGILLISATSSGEFTVRTMDSTGCELQNSPDTIGLAITDFDIYSTSAAGYIVAHLYNSEIRPVSYILGEGNVLRKDGLPITFQGRRFELAGTNESYAIALLNNKTLSYQFGAFEVKP